MREGSLKNRNFFIAIKHKLHFFSWSRTAFCLQTESDRRTCKRSNGLRVEM